VRHWKKGVLLGAKFVRSQSKADLAVSINNAPAYFYAYIGNEREMRLELNKK